MHTQFCQLIYKVQQMNAASLSVRSYYKVCVTGATCAEVQMLIFGGETERLRLSSTSQGRQEPVAPQTRKKEERTRQTKRCGGKHIKLRSLGGSAGYL